MYRVTCVSGNNMYAWTCTQQPHSHVSRLQQTKDFNTTHLRPASRTLILERSTHKSDKSQKTPGSSVTRREKAGRGRSRPTTHTYCRRGKLAAITAVCCDCRCVYPIPEQGRRSIINEELLRENGALQDTWRG